MVFHEQGLHYAAIEQTILSILLIESALVKGIIVYAIIEDSGTQIKVNEGDRFDLDLKTADPGADITFDRILMVSDGEGKTTLGTPYIKGATVSAKVIEHKKGEKIDVIKFKRRKGYRRKMGHRQRYTTVSITAINPG